MVLLVAVVSVPSAVGLAHLPPVKAAMLGEAPRQFDSGSCAGGRSPPSDCSRLPGVLGVAHNAGDRPAAARRALSHGAELVEIDVVEAGSELKVGHDEPWPVIGNLVHPGQPLAEAWRAADPAGVLLDLKQPGVDPQDVAAFLRDRHDPDRPVFVTTRDLSLAARLATSVPEPVTVLFTVPDPGALQRLFGDPAAAGPIDGLSLYEGLVDRPTAGRARSRGWFLLAWTVNDGRRLQEIVALGVDAVVTEDDALLRAMRGP